MFLSQRTLLHNSVLLPLETSPFQVSIPPEKGPLAGLNQYEIIHT